MEGRGCGLVGSNISEFVWKNLSKTTKNSVCSVSGPRIQPGTSKVWSNTAVNRTFLLVRGSSHTCCLWGKRGVVWRMGGNYPVFSTHVYSVIMWISYRHFACFPATVKVCHTQWHDKILPIATLASTCSNSSMSCSLITHTNMNMIYCPL